MYCIKIEIFKAVFCDTCKRIEFNKPVFEVYSNSVAPYLFNTIEEAEEFIKRWISPYYESKTKIEVFIK